MLQVRSFLHGTSFLYLSQINEAFGSLLIVFVEGSEIFAHVFFEDCVKAKAENSDS